MLPVWPELVSPGALAADDALAVVSFGVPLSGAAVAIPIRQLGAAPLFEVWRSSLPVTRARCGEVSFSSNGAALLGTVAAHGSDTESVTARLYEQIVQTARRAGYPHLLRVWNHVGAINECEGDLDHYRHFSVGRHEALTRLGYAREQFPAASAVGMSAEGVAIYFIASRVRAVQVENPRQVAAYEYPPLFGPRSPSFSRATVAQWDRETMIFISGTSSVVGHETRHAGDVEAQLDETLRNLEKIVCEAAARVGLRATLDNLRIVKTYMRRAADYDRLSSLLIASLPGAQHLFLESDICRRDLLVEVEGIVRI
jgi:chorismate lyase / 3-hydroxybenzoate synthase